MDHVKTLGKYTFVATFGMTLFLELFLGVPGVLFIVLPHIADNFNQIDLIAPETTLIAVLVLVLSAAVVLTFKLLNAHRIDYASFFRDDLVINLRRLVAYDFITAVALFVLSVLYIIQPDNLSYLLLPAGQRLFQQASALYELNGCGPNGLWPNTSAWANTYVDSVQQVQQCCGWIHPKEWIELQPKHTNQPVKRVKSLPLSCCPMQEDRPCRACTLHSLNHFKSGCKESVVRLLNTHNTLSYGLGIAYYLLKSITYFTYCGAFKEAIDEGNYMISYSNE
jgi:hypothetical protein